MRGDVLLDPGSSLGRVDGGALNLSLLARTTAVGWWLWASACGTAPDPSDDTDVVETDDLVVDTDETDAPTITPGPVIPPFERGTCLDRGDDLVLPTVPTWAEDVAPILFERCLGCHVDGGSAPFALRTYDDAVRWAPAIRASVMSRTMPPPSPTDCGECNHFQNARWLSSDEIATVRTWVEGGTPQGDLSRTPSLPSPPSALSPVDLVLEMAEAYLPPVDRGDDHRCFVLETGLDAQRFVTGFELIAGEGSVVHHATLYALDTDTSADAARALDEADEGYGYACYGSAGVPGADFVGGWVPGVGPIRYPEGTGIKLPAGRPLVLQVHYLVRQGANADRSRLHLRLAETVRRNAAMLSFFNRSFELPGGQDYVTAERLFPRLMAEAPVDALTLWGIGPHMHELGRTLHVELLPADAPPRCLVDVVNYEFEAQGLFLYDEPIVVSPDDALRITCGWDTSGKTEVTRFGGGLDDEMCMVIVYGTVGRPEDVLAPPE